MATPNNTTGGTKIDTRSNDIKLKALNKEIENIAEILSNPIITSLFNIIQVNSDVLVTAPVEWGELKSAINQVQVIVGVEPS